MLDLAPLVLGCLAIAAMIVLLLTGVPVVYAMGIVALFGLWMLGGQGMVFATLNTLPYDSASNYSFVVIPMFVLMGAFASRSRITDDLYSAFYKLFSHLRGSLLIVTTVSSAGFAAVSGSTMVNAVVFTRIALPQMARFGYDHKIGAGCIAAAGTFAALIPPSIMMVIYAILTNESTGALLMAGVIPGIGTALIYVAFIILMVRIRPNWAPIPIERFSVREKLASLRTVWPFAVLGAIVTVGIYTGTMYPSSAGAVGAIGALLLGLALKRIDRPGFAGTIKETAITTTILFSVLITGLLFSRFLVYSGFVTDLVDLVKDSGLHRFAVLALIILMYLVLGCVMDSVSMTVVTIPFVYPLIKALGFDAIWFGVIMIKLIEIAVITPPVGLNLFAVVSASEGKVSTAEIYRGVMPFVMLEILVLTVLVIFPEISLWLPKLMLTK